MKKHIINATVLVASLAFASACKVDEDYSYENIKNVDTGITVFQDGISIPIGSTEKIVLETLLDKEGILDDEMKDYLKTGEDGSYSLNFSGNFDFTDKIADFNLSELEDVIPEIKFNFSEKAGIAGASYDFDMNLSPLQCTSDILDKSLVSTAISALGSGDFSLPASVGTEFVFDPYSTTFDPIELPSQIKSIKSITLSENAAVKVTLSLVNPMLKSGKVVPSVSFDVSDLLALDGGNALDMSTLVLSETNNYSASQLFPIKSVNVSKLTQKKTLSGSGKIILSNPVTNKAIVGGAAGNMGLKVSVEFIDVTIKSIQCEINPYETTLDESIEINLKETELPEQIKSVKEVTFAEGHNKIDLNLELGNINKIKGLNATLNTLSVTFPSNFKIEGDGITGNTLTLTNVSLNSPLTKTVTVKSMTLPSPVNGKISYLASIPVKAKATASGTINSSDIPAKAEDDVTISASVNGNLQIDQITATSDYSVSYEAGIPMFDISQISDNWNLDLPEIDANLAITGNLAIPVSGNVEVGEDKYKIEFPYSADGKNVTAENKLKLDFNRTINAKPVPDSIIFKVTAELDPNRDCIVRLSDKYSLSVDYDCSMPIQLGEDTKLSISDTIKVDSEEITKFISDNSLALTGTITSTLPMGLDMTIRLLNTKDGGNTINSIPLKEPISITVKADGESDFNCKVNIADNAKIDRLYGFVLDIEVSANGQTLRSSDYVQAKLAVSLPNGYTIK